MAEVLDARDQPAGAPLPGVIPFEIRLVGLGIDGARGGETRAVLGSKFDSDAFGDGSRELTLQRQYILQFAFVRAGPEVAVSVRVE